MKMLTISILILRMKLCNLSDVHPRLRYDAETPLGDLYLSDPSMLPHILISIVR